MLIVNQDAVDITKMMAAPLPRWPCKLLQGSWIYPMALLDMLFSATIATSF